MEPLLTNISDYQRRARNSGKYTMIWSFTFLPVASSALSILAFAVMLYCNLRTAATT
jgi:hypothetical protein